MSTKEPLSCIWPGADPLMQQYHDTEWGSPVLDDDKLFEFMLLDTFQAGLSWRTILYKREAFRQAFAGFNPREIAHFTEEDVARLMQNTGIIRNRLKIKAAITNAQAFLKMQQEHGSFSVFIWQFTGGKPVNRKPSGHGDYLTASPESDAMSHALKKAGFKFVGTTICYAFMQAAGMINDHLITCPRHAAVTREWENRNRQCAI